MRARIESLAYGPHGVARVDGKVYFVRHTVPGDEIELEVREDHRSYAFAEMTSLLQAGDARRVPPCEYLPRCGGCDWQQVEYGAQLAAKERSVGELVRRLGHLRDAQVLPILSPGPELGYRRRLSLRVEGGRVGYFAAGSHELVAVAHCLLAARELDGALPLAQRWVDGLSTTVKRLEIAAAGDGDGLVFAAQAEGRFLESDDGDTTAFLSSEPRVRGVVLRGRGWRHSWGDDRVRFDLGGESLLLHAGGFVQVNDAANAALIEVVLDFAACGAGDRVLDLYAGFGNLTFPLARRAREVTAVERSAESVRDGEAHASERGCNTVTFVTADAPAVLKAWVRHGRKAEVAVLDPPRSGAAEAMPSLLQIAPRRIVYVSCNPSTLARDLETLSRRYRIGRIQPIDFFPQTHHVEAVAELVLTDT